MAVVPRARNDRAARRECGERHGGRGHREVPPEVIDGTGSRSWWAAISWSWWSVATSSAMPSPTDAGVRGTRRRSRRCPGWGWGRPAGPRVLVRDHHPDGDGGPGGQQRPRHGSGVALGRRHDPWSRESWVAGWSSLVTSSDQHHFMEATTRTSALDPPVDGYVNPAQSDQRDGVEAPFHPMKGAYAKMTQRPAPFGAVAVEASCPRHGLEVDRHP